MAATRVTRLPIGPGWSYEPKFDGFRALAFCHRRDGVVLQSRQLRPLTDAFPDITTTLTNLHGLGKGGVVLDGELVIWRAGRLDFAALQDRLRSGPTPGVGGGGGWPRRGTASSGGRAVGPPPPGSPPSAPPPPASGIWPPRRRRRSWCSTCSPTAAPTCAPSPTGSGGPRWRSC